MESKDIIPFIGVAGSIVGGLAWIWKKMVKPTMNFVKRVEGMEGKMSKIENLTDDVTFINKQSDSIIHLSDVAMFVCNSDGLCVLANQALCDLFGATENQMRGLGWINFLHPDDKDRAWKTWRLAIDNGASDIKEHYTIIHGETQEEIEAIYHAIIARDNKMNVIISVGRVEKHK